MTASHSAPLGFPHNLYAALRRLISFAIKSAAALFILVMASIIAIATAAAGLAIATVAVLIGLFGSRPERSNVFDESDSQGMTLNARKTPRGWTVE